MNRSFNAWWILPVITGTIGIMLGVILTPNKAIRSPIIAPLEHNLIASNHLSITQVLLPPEPVIIAPVLTATLTNNKVELNSSPEDIAVSKPTRVDKVKNNDINTTSESLELAEKFSQIMQEMANEEQDAPSTANQLHAQELTQHPQWYQDLVPELDFSSHIYASNKNERWVRVNNQVVQEGELITSTMRLISIEPQYVIIEMHERRFTLPALTSW